MHAIHMPSGWERFRERLSYALHPHPTDAEHPASHRLKDNPDRARLGEVRMVPLAVPGMALVLLLVALLIGSLMRM